MPEVAANTRLYIATRTHSTAGTLIKVGVSSNPSARCRSLGARIILGEDGLIPRDVESVIKRRLQPWAVWTIDDQGWFRVGPKPMFTAPTEWFYATSEALSVLRDILEAA